jgi:DNA invertase Pin-like site-specific DNA recombinase
MGTTNPKKIAAVVKLYKERSLPVKEICERLHISKSTLYWYL